MLHACASWTGGHLTEPYEQKTQQSPGFGRSNVRHPAHSWKWRHASTGITSTAANPQRGHVRTESRIGCEVIMWRADAVCSAIRPTKRATATTTCGEVCIGTGGDAGIRTLDTGFCPYAPLAGECLRPLGHVSGNPLDCIGAYTSGQTACGQFARCSGCLHFNRSAVRAPCRRTRTAIHPVNTDIHFRTGPASVCRCR